MPDSVESLQRLAPFVMGRPHLIRRLLGPHRRRWLFGSMVLLLFSISGHWLVAA
ncbi:MAG: hypothetical protein RAK19_01905 [Synechococcus sp. SP1 MAG]|nr:hypothetical protein [Synechococcus sp. SP1 MAG]